MRRRAAVVLAGTVLWVGACHKAADQQASANTAQAAGAPQIAWREGDVDDGFAEAKESGKPVLLYWGAKWCPPCNQLKSTLFKDPQFIAETRNFVPVYLDGDSKGAQVWGDRFGISGYPTVIILRPDRSEVTRLSSGSGGANLADLLRAAATRTTSFDDLLQKADADPKSLTPDDWRLLADFDWQNDPKRFKEAGKAAAILDKLATAAPDPASQRRFALLALTSGLSTDDKGKATLTPAQQAQVVSILPAILSSPAEAKANHLELGYAAPSMVAALPAAERDALAPKLIATLDTFYADASLPIPDRLSTVNGDITLAKANLGDQAPVPAPVLAKVRERVAWADGAAKDQMTRQSVMASAAELLDDAGDAAGAEKLLRAELSRSASPYYYMSDLAGLAEEHKDKAGAVRWAKQAAETAQGPATRVQWAVNYAQTVLRLTPDDKAAVGESAEAVIAAIGDSPDDYYQRTRNKVNAWGGALKKWSAAHDGGALLTKLDARMAGACARQGDAQDACKGWLTSAAA